MPLSTKNILSNLFTGLTVLCFFANAQAQKTVSFQDAHVREMGRIAYKSDYAVLYYSGTSLEINFTGTGVKAWLKDERGDNYFNVIVDGKIVVLHPDTAKRLYTLASGLTYGNHTLQLYKRSEWGDGSTNFYSFQFDNSATILPAPPVKKRAIEFYGNSITAGYAIEDYSGRDSYLSRYKNNYITYAALTARHYDAQWSFIAKSGIGVTVGYYPATMPEIYERLDPLDEKSKWDFSKYTPQVVVVNLFQNDAGVIQSGSGALFEARFGHTPPTEQFIVNTYKNFIKGIRSKYPKASIICSLGSMSACKPGLPWSGYIQSAVQQLNDKNIYSFIFTYKNTPGHPTVKEHQAMADELIGFIDKTIKW
ncbi:electron transporter RnfD [Mucilaginibacter sp. HMF5004]|uniref:GDSL-type esterase/lipase family protein n=1 Tax=Mucilaginibacter rivuli TaxID=2857527 RepID=UPI001C5CD4B7|nr:GDSL-type esterase/lipase family protein [Mucilaginibacter rivuli]MBW4890775.1 electron transporter RnfD [Mucilaginibacter rivuli]